MSSGSQPVRYHVLHRTSYAYGLPMADGYKAVLRRVDGCNAPIIVGYGLGR